MGWVTGFVLSEVVTACSQTDYQAVNRQDSIDHQTRTAIDKQLHVPSPADCVHRHGDGARGRWWVQLVIQILADVALHEPKVISCHLACDCARADCTKHQREAR